MRASPFRYFSVVLGAISLVMLVLGLLTFANPDGFGVLTSSPVAGLGKGRAERWVVYPVVLWLASFGGYLMGARTSS